MPVRLKMVNTSTGTSTMSANPSKAVKRVAKKETTEVVVTAAPVAVAAVAAPVAAAAAAPATKRVSKKAATETAVATSQVETVVAAAAAAPVVANTVEAVPDASAVAAGAAVPTTSVQQDIEALMTDVQAVRDSAVNTLKALQRLSKRVARDLKAAGRRRRARRSEDATDAENKRPTIFKTPVTLKNELCAFLGKANGTQMAPADVTKAFSAYVDANGLKNAEKGQGHTIHPNAAMRKLFGLAEGETVSYRNVQKHLYKLYELKSRNTTA